MKLTQAPYTKSALTLIDVIVPYAARFSKSMFDWDDMCLTRG